MTDDKDDKKDFIDKLFDAADDLVGGAEAVFAKAQPEWQVEQGVPIAHHQGEQGLVVYTPSPCVVRARDGRALVTADPALATRVCELLNRHGDGR